MQIKSFLKKEDLRLRFGVLVALLTVSFFFNVQDVSAQQDAVVGNGFNVKSAVYTNSPTFLTTSTAKTALMDKVNDLRSVSPLTYSGMEEITTPLRMSYFLAVHESLEQGTSVPVALTSKYNEVLLREASRYKSNLVNQTVLQSIVDEALSLVSQ